MLDDANSTTASADQAVTNTKQKMNLSKVQTALISVVVPAYNVEKFIAECLDSLVAQDDPDFEVIIVDDGSTDGTSAIITAYTERYTNFRVIQQDNGGLGAARNTGVAAANGEFILFVDSDDYVSTNAVSTLRRAQLQGNCDVVTGGFVRMSPTGEVDPTKTDALPQHEIPAGLPELEEWMKVLGVFAPSIACARLYRRDILLRDEVAFHDRVPHEDLFFTYKALIAAERSCIVDAPIYFYRQHDATISKSISTAHIDVLIVQWEDACQFLDKIEAPEIAYALAARRTLFLLEGFRKKAAEVSPEIQAHLDALLSEHQDQFRELLSTFELSPVAQALTYHGPVNLIKAIPRRKPSQAGKDVRELTGNTDADALLGKSEVLFPGDAMDFGTYRQYDLGQATQEDRDRLAPFYNKYKGQRCFIIGNGPSLNKHDLSKLEGEFVFAVNSFYYKTRETGFRPTFFVVEDTKVMEENAEEIKAYEAPYKFFPAQYKSFHPADGNVFFFSMDQGFYRANSPYYCVPRFSTDATRQLYCGQSVTYINLQLAFFMGFTEVYLIGMDFDYIIPKEHERRGNHIISTTDDPNHFHKDYFGKGKTWKDPKLDRVGMNYEQAKLSFEAVGRKVYNATIGGKLEIFPRAHYDLLFSDNQSGSSQASTLTQIQSRPSPSRAEIRARRLKKLLRDPHRYFADSKVEPLRVLRHLFSKYEKDKDKQVSKRRAKFNRDPHLYFADSKSVFGRSLKYLFSPTGWNNWQYEAVRDGRRAASGLFSWMPSSRKSLAGAMALAERKQLAADTRMAKSLAKDRQEHSSRISSLRDAIRRLQQQYSRMSDVEEIVAKQRGILEQRLLDQARANARREAKLRDEIAALRDEMAALVATSNKEMSSKIAKSTEEMTSLVRKARDNAMRHASDEVEKSSASLTNLLRQVRDNAVTATEAKVQESVAPLELARLRQVKINRLTRERIATGERQIGRLKYPKQPQSLVFFGHHKCASRFFRLEIFPLVAEAIGATVHKYEIKNPPFHYSTGEELDLHNIDFENIGTNARDLVLFSNATPKIHQRLDDATRDWRGIRVIRDPRQIFASNYLHHKGDHRVENHGWVYDKLKKDQPILRELPLEEGLIHELDNISKDILETQIFAPFGDGRILTIKLEDFSQDVEAGLQLIAEFLRIPDIGGADITRTYANPESQSWDVLFTPRVREIFKERYGQPLIDLGYAEDFDW